MAALGNKAVWDFLLTPEKIFKFLEFIGYGACHQRVNLTFNYMQAHMPVCSRCTGIYIGFILSAAVLLLIERRIKNRLPGRIIVVTAAVLFAVMAAESALSFLKIIPSFNLARFLTGYSVGWFLSIILIPLLNSVVFAPGLCAQEQYLKKAGYSIVWIFSGAITGLIFLVTYKQIILFWSIAAIAGLILFVAVLILILIFAAAVKLRSTVQNPYKFLAFFLLAIAISIALISLSSYLKRIVNPYLSYPYGYLKSIISR